jgi:hypothetical protein
VLGVGLQHQPGKIYCYKTSRACGGDQNPHRVAAPIKKKKPYDKYRKVIEHMHDIPLKKIGFNESAST